MITGADRFFLGHLSMRKQVSTFFENERSRGFRWSVFAKFIALEVTFGPLVK